MLRTAAVVTALLATANAESTKIQLEKQEFKVSGEVYSRFAVKGSGPQWEMMNGQGGIRLKKDEKVREFDVTYVNNLDEPSAMHQHGLVPPRDYYDGVPYLQQPPINPGESRDIKFEVTSNHTGSLFVHSHYGPQHIDGLAIPLIVEDDAPEGYPLQAEVDASEDVVMFLEDFCPYAEDDGPETNPFCNNTEGAYRSLAAGWEEDKDDFDYEECSEAGEESDISFRYFLANGRAFDDPETVVVKPGQTIRLRMVSSTAMTSFKVDLGVLSGHAIATDGQYVKPLPGSIFWVGIAQRLDVLVTIPEDGDDTLFPIRALGEGASESMQCGLVFVMEGTPKPMPGKYPTMSGEIAGWMDVEQELRLRAFTSLPAVVGNQRTVKYTLNITGDNGFNSLNRRSWQLPPYADVFTPNPNPLRVRGGDRVCITYKNYNADPHPMHLHGHSFQIVNINGVAYDGAIRDVVMVPRGLCQTVEICFDADAPGIDAEGAKWPLHCHMSYHLAAGMLTTVEYEK